MYSGITCELIKNIAPSPGPEFLLSGSAKGQRVAVSIRRPGQEAVLKHLGELGQVAASDLPANPS